MSQVHLPESFTTCNKEAEEDRSQRTSDYYRVHDDLPARFNHPGWFRGYRILVLLFPYQTFPLYPISLTTGGFLVPGDRTNEPHPMYRTTNQIYGSKAPTVHEMPTSFNITSHSFSKHLGKCGMYTNNGLNTYMEKSDVTGIDNHITFYDRLNFHPSYNGSGPSHCE